eukprot:TRINITY_DN73861_c0_g1_i1.p1 TRINITY_DN73861_c0_g1~~TRINITY_DN73861_c0_g1_i1.p1  ORF type:complete len:145 (-),score=37.28 TRINITY_DN73861_c0_g1_i1:107-508(-)
MAASSPATLELGTQPVLLSNGNGWANVTRFTSLAITKLADMKRRAKLSSAGALARALARIEQRQQREGLQRLRQRANSEAFVAARSNADAMLQKLRRLVDNFELEIEDNVDGICREVLHEDDDEADGGPYYKH